MGVRFHWTTRADGDFSDPARAPAVSGAPARWTWLDQRHGCNVVEVGAPGQHAGAVADAAVSVAPGCTLVVRTADCVPLVLVGERGVGVAHVGWRGALAGVVRAAVEALGALGAPPARAHLGPCIRPGCYEFQGPALSGLVQRFGAGIRSRTTWGAPAVDLPGLVRVACWEAGVEEVQDASGCTACDQRWFSHRARGETARLATLAWIEAD